MALTYATPAIATDPGYLLWAPLGSTEPTNTVVGSVFTDDWDVAWVLLGATEAGSTFAYQTTTETIDVAEFLDPIRIVSTGRAGSIAFALASITASNVKKALNGGTATVTGSTTTTKTVYTPPAVGSEVRAMIGWESSDHTERLVAYQCFQTGSLSMGRAKGAAKSVINCEFSFEVPTSGIPFKYITAGTARA